MEWTRQKPIGPGMYQYRPIDAGLFVFYCVERPPSGELVGAVSGSLEHLAHEELPCKWRGPIMDLEPWR